MKLITAVIVSAALAAPATAAAAPTGATMTFDPQVHRIERQLIRAEHQVAIDIHNRCSQAQINADGLRVKILAHKMRLALLQQAGPTTL